MDANPSGHATRPESHSTGPPDRGVGRRGGTTRLAREGAAGPLQRQRWLAAANPSKWLKTSTNTHDPCGSRAPSDRRDPCGSPPRPVQSHPSPPPPGPPPPAPCPPGPGPPDRTLGAARPLMSGACGERVGAAAWIVEVSVSPAAAWIVTLTGCAAAAWIVVVSSALQPL